MGTYDQTELTPRRGCTTGPQPEEGVIDLERTMFLRLAVTLLLAQAAHSFLRNPAGPWRGAARVEQVPQSLDAGALEADPGPMQAPNGHNRMVKPISAESLRATVLAAAHTLISRVQENQNVSLPGLSDLPKLKNPDEFLRVLGFENPKTANATRVRRSLRMKPYLSTRRGKPNPMTNQLKHIAEALGALVSTVQHLSNCEGPNQEEDMHNGPRPMDPYNEPWKRLRFYAARGRRDPNVQHLKNSAGALDALVDAVQRMSNCQGGQKIIQMMGPIPEENINEYYPRMKPYFSDSRGKPNAMTNQLKHIADALGALVNTVQRLSNCEGPNREEDMNSGYEPMDPYNDFFRQPMQVAVPNTNRFSAAKGGRDPNIQHLKNIGGALDALVGAVQHMSRCQGNVEIIQVIKPISEENMNDDYSRTKPDFAARRGKVVTNQLKHIAEALGALVNTVQRLSNCEGPNQEEDMHNGSKPMDPFNEPFWKRRQRVDPNANRFYAARGGRDPNIQHLKNIAGALDALVDAVQQISKCQGNQEIIQISGVNVNDDHRPRDPYDDEYRPRDPYDESIWKRMKRQAEKPGTNGELSNKITGRRDWTDTNTKRTAYVTQVRALSNSTKNSLPEDTRMPVIKTQKIDGLTSEKHRPKRQADFSYDLNNLSPGQKEIFESLLDRFSKCYTFLTQIKIEMEAVGKTGDDLPFILQKMIDEGLNPEVWLPNQSNPEDPLPSETNEDGINDLLIGVQECVAYLTDITNDGKIDVATETGRVSLMQSLVSVLSQRPELWEKIRIESWPKQWFARQRGFQGHLGQNVHNLVNKLIHKAEKEIESGNASYEVNKHLIGRESKWNQAKHSTPTPKLRKALILVQQKIEQAQAEGKSEKELQRIVEKIVAQSHIRKRTNTMRRNLAAIRHLGNLSRQSYTSFLENMIKEAEAEGKSEDEIKDMIEKLVISKMHGPARKRQGQAWQAENNLTGAQKQQYEEVSSQLRNFLDYLKAVVDEAEGAREKKGVKFHHIDSFITPKIRE